MALARDVNYIIAARGKKVVRFDMKKDAPDDDTLASQLLGPTGNLRAPALRKGKTLIIGFSQDVYEAAFEAK